MWVFGYGSLMWNPNFEYEKVIIGVLEGYERDFCIKTFHHRGDKDNHGLVLGLKEATNRNCVGMLFKIKESNVKNVENYLDERELYENSYYKKNYNILTEKGHVEALVYFSNNNSNLFFEAECNHKANIIKKAKGHSGFNIDYYLNTIKYLNDIGIEKEKIFNIKGFL